MMIMQSTNITSVIENLKVNCNILGQFKEVNDPEKSYRSKIKLVEENVEKLKTKIKDWLKKLLII